MTILESGKMLEPLSTEHEDGQHDHPVGRGRFVDIHRKDYNSVLSNGHDVFDRALLQDTRNRLDDAANILDDYEGGQLDPTNCRTQLPVCLMSNHTSLPYRIYHTE
jgi:hypothetical protein